MGKIPISYKAYDNKYAAPMGICLSVGGTFFIGGLMCNEMSVFVIGIIGIVLFVFFKILNSMCAKEEAEEAVNNQINMFKNEVEIILENDDIDNREKIRSLIELSKEGNCYATLILEELAKQIDEEK